jgi:hypothetical protein
VLPPRRASSRTHNVAATTKNVTNTSSIAVRDMTTCRKSTASRPAPMPAATVDRPSTRASTKSSVTVAAPRRAPAARHPVGSYPSTWIPIAISHFPRGGCIGVISAAAAQRLVARM